MKNAFIIVYDNTSVSKGEEISEVIRSNFISKRSAENSFVIKNTENKSPKVIFDLIQSKLTFESAFYVIEMNQFYGRFYADALNWLSEQFPSKNWFTEK